MADPITIMAGMTMVGGLMGAMGAQAQGNAAAAAGQFNADIAGRNAGLAREAAAADATIQERQSRMQMGAIRAAYGASGVTAAGSPLDVLEMSAANADRDHKAILYKGELKALGYEDTRTLSLYGADSAKTQADWATASSLLTGFTGGAKTLAFGKTGTSAGAPALLS
jgi:hypothetical protein